MKLLGKVAIITGGASGIGKATANLFVKNGAKVVFADVSNQEENTVEELINIGGEAIFIKTDVSKEADINNLVEETVRLLVSSMLWLRMLELDILVHIFVKSPWNAGSRCSILT